MSRLRTATTLAALVLLSAACRGGGGQAGEGAPPSGTQDGKHTTSATETAAVAGGEAGEAGDGEVRAQDGAGAAPAGRDLLADEVHVSAGTPDARYADLARRSGLWVLAESGDMQSWSTARAGGVEGMALDDDGVKLRLAEADAAGQCLHLVVGAAEGARIQIARVAGGRREVTLVAGSQVVPATCPFDDFAGFTEIVIKHIEGDAVIAGLWLGPEGADLPAEPPEAPGPCDGDEGEGVAIDAGETLRIAALAEPGSRVEIASRGATAGSLAAGVRVDGAAEPLAIALEAVPGEPDAARGTRDVEADRTAGIEIEVTLAADAGSPACLTDVRLVAPDDGAGDEASGGALPTAVVLVMTDTMRGDLYPHESSPVSVEMPNVQALAERSTVFTQATAHASYTKPSVGSILTGVYPEQHGGLPRKAPVGDHVDLVSQILSGSGIESVAFMSNYFFNPVFGLRRGWTDEHFVDPFGAALDDSIVVEEFEKWCDGGIPERPLFVYVHLMGAHAPYAPPPSYRASFLEGRNLARRIQPRHTAQLIKDLTAGRAKKLNYTERSQLKALYRADAAYHDEVLGRLLAAMEKSGLLEDSLFIYTSDHGEEFYEHGRVGHGTGLWNEQVHVPLIVRRPGQGRRVDVDTVVGHVDIVPTILEALTVDVPAHLPGRSLLELMDGGGPSDRGLLLQHWTGRWGIQLGPWKLQRRPTDERVSWSWGPDEDEVDPAAAAITHRLLRLELARAYADLAGAQDGSPGIDEVEMSPELLEQLQGLGYFDQ